MSELERNERSVLKGLGTASLSVVLLFFSTVSLVYIEKSGIALAVGVVLCILASLPVTALMSEDIKDFLVKAASYTVSLAVYIVIFMRIGYYSALKRYIAAGKLSEGDLTTAALCFICFFLFFLIISFVTGLFAKRSGSLSRISEKIGQSGQKIQVVLIAAAFLCIAVASMIFG